MNRQPQGVHRRAFHPMLAMGRDQQVIARLEFDLLFVRKGEGGGAFEEENPFVLRLVIPKILRARLAVGLNPLDAAGVALQQRFDNFPTGRGRGELKQIAGDKGHRIGSIVAREKFRFAILEFYAPDTAIISKENKTQREMIGAILPQQFHALANEVFAAGGVLL